MKHKNVYNLLVGILSPIPVICLYYALLLCYIMSDIMDKPSSRLQLGEGFQRRSSAQFSMLLIWRLAHYRCKWPLPLRLVGYKKCPCFVITLVQLVLPDKLISVPIVLIFRHMDKLTLQVL